MRKQKIKKGSKRDKIKEFEVSWSIKLEFWKRW